MTTDPRPTTPAGLRVDRLDIRYGRALPAVRQVCLHVEPGSVAALLGANGAGKSTLLRAVSGTLPLHGGAVTGGTVEVDGRPLDWRDAASTVAAGVVQVPEGRRVFPALSVADNLDAGALGPRSPRGARRRAARDEVYDLFPVLARRRGQPAGTLSGGEQQMLAIGRALMAAPRLLLLDEPSLGLAPRVVQTVAEVIRQINRSGVTVVLVEQNAALALGVADHAHVLDLGRVRLSGAAAQLATSDEVRRLYLGEAPDASEPEPTGTGAEGDVEPSDPDHGDHGPRARRADTRPAAPARAEPGGSPALPTPSDPRGVGDRDREPPIPGRPVHTGRAAVPLRVRSLTVRFAGLVALDDVDLTVEPGSLHAVIGPNGAGKSTFFNVLSGVCRAATGSVVLGDHDLTRTAPHRIAALGVARTFQNVVLARGTVSDNLMLGRHVLTRAGLLASALRLPGAVREERTHRARVREVAELVGLGDLTDTPVDLLSYGDRKRVELARALCMEPRLLLLDEPVAGMNGAERRRMVDLIARVRAELAPSILLVEHDMPLVMGLADEVTVLDFGRSVATGPPERVRGDPAVIAAYLGGVPVPVPVPESAAGPGTATATTLPEDPR
ncbi:branched-chain amino acid ABC transporter ATP-binding protein [Actinoalloteichus sp. AHMU CJ021]|uniref:ATP-binding cassette domain-containing protein n=1 Tax=Actinoalloteichus sp. AHMU CJ021 TaxID=2072503 RepID=UPI000CA016C2|nr:branched-chain amino acid ABC transporter ATP-binding protein [Actinoalloteichus sp. AHMU CJ021]